MKNKTLSFVITLSLLLSMFPMSTFADSPIVTDPATRDIFLNVDSDAGYSASELADAVSTQITSIGGTSAPAFRIKTNSTEINTTDLSGWYVYDHYDTKYWSQAQYEQAVTSPQSVGGYGSTLANRPYYGMTEGSVNSATPIEISSIGTSGFPTGFTYYLKEHIYSYSLNGKPAMKFHGYSTSNYADFLYYPAAKDGTKTVKFDVNASNVVTHSLRYAGFLINAGISGDNINGYLILFEYSPAASNSPATGLTGVYLYKLTNASVASLHASGLKGLVSSNTAGYTLIKTATSPTFYAQSSIDLTITSTQLVAKMQKMGDASTLQTLFSEALTDTGYGGFGPYVDYGVSGHTCSNTSSFVYSNLEMGSSNASGAVSALASLQNADYLDSGITKRYLVNILGASSYNLTKDQNYLATVQAQSIRLFTNTSVSSISDYLPGYYFDNSSNSISTLAISIANYILDITGTETVTISPATTTSTVAIFTLTSGAVQVSQIKRELIPIDGVELGVNNKSIPSSGSSLSTTPGYILVKPSGNESSITVPFTVTNSAISWPTGEYKLTMDYGTGTIPATVKFRIIEDATAPTVVATSSSGVMNFTITNVEGSGSNAYTTDLDSYVIENTSTAAATTSNWDNHFHIVNNATTGSATITQSGYMHVLVKDKAGNIGQSYIYVSLLYPTITAPVASNINVGQTLGDSTLSGGSAVYSGTTIAGVFSWVDSTTIPAVGTTTFSAIFTPSQSGIYGTVTTSVAVTVIQPSSGITKTIKLTEVKSDVLENTDLIEVRANMAGAFRNSVEVKITDVQAADESVFKIVGGYSEVYPFDISVYNTITKLKVQPNSGYTVKITIPLPEKLWDSRDNVKVVYLNEGKLVTLTSTLVQKQGVWCIVFEADHFSAYALVLNNEPEVVTPGVTPDAIGTMGFEDVSEMNWFYNAVQYISGKGLMAGITKDSFGPTLKTSRAMIVTILYRMEGEPKVTTTSGFADVLTGKYYADAVAWGAQNGVVLGYDAQTFRPKENISRQQMAAILFRYATYKGYDVSKTAELGVYPDANNISKWASGNFTWSVAEGLIAGTNNNALDPRGDLTRSQAATTLMRFIENIK